MFNIPTAASIKNKIKTNNKPGAGVPKVMCMDEPRSFYLEQKWGSDERIYINVTIKSDINESLRKQLKDLDKKLVLYSRTHTYRIDEFGEDSLRPSI